MAMSEQLGGWTKKYESLSGTSKLLIGGGFGAAAGAVTVLTNDKDDTLLSGAKTIAMGAAIDIATDKFGEELLGGDRLAIMNNMMKGKMSLPMIKESVKAGSKTAFTGSKGVGTLIGAGVGMVAGGSNGLLGTAWDGLVYGTAGYGAGALFEQIQKDKLLKKGIEAKPEEPSPPEKVKQLPDTPPETPKQSATTFNEGSHTTAGTISNPIDNDTALETMNKKKEITTGNVGPEIDKAENKKNMNRPFKGKTPPSPIDTQKATTRAVGGVGGVKALMIGGAAVFGAGVVADINNRMTDKRLTERQIRIQENNLKNKETEEKKDMRKLFGYDYMDYGNIVGELWNNRTGHHKMGNAKFY